MISNHTYLIAGEIFKYIAKNIDNVIFFARIIIMTTARQFDFIFH